MAHLGGWLKLPVSFAHTIVGYILLEHSRILILTINFLTLLAQKFTNFQMDIKRYDFDTRRECRQKRKDIGRSKFEQTLLKTWGLEAQKDDSQLESTFWVSECSSGITSTINLLQTNWSSGTLRNQLGLIRYIQLYYFLPVGHYLLKII